jgi:uncharacterized damage-inducible protein DinB
MRLFPLDVGCNTSFMPTFAQSVASYTAQADVLSTWLEGLSAAQCDAVPTEKAAGLWSMRQLVIHMLDSDLAATHRIRRMVAEDKPLLIAYDETAFCANAAICGADLRQVAALFSANRRFTGAFLAALPRDSWTRPGVHNHRGLVTVEQMVGLYVHHADHHGAFARAKRLAMGVATSW